MSAVATDDLFATRPLEILDELRVPYRSCDRAESRSDWAALRTSNPDRALYWHVGQAPGGQWRIGSTPLWGGLVPAEDVQAFAGTLGPTWEPVEPIVDDSGTTRSFVWRSSDGGTILPFDPDELVGNLRSERYQLYRWGPWRSVLRHARRAYYAVRPVMARRVQIAMRRAFARVQSKSSFPRWPVEPALHDLSDFVLQCVADIAAAPIPFIAAWPAGRRWALVLTHDVETSIGRDRIERLLEVERAAGFRSAWYLVPERYAVADALVTNLISEGGEVGVHGLRHDGRDLDSLETLRQRRPEIARWASRWGAVGFRAPAMHRVWEWMPTLGFDYDSSYPDTDPYEPMPGGCCSWLPFFNDGMVELPVTLPQDHTVFVILRRDDVVWRDKVAVLRQRGGMALLNVHPDYMAEDARLDAYVRFLAPFRDDPEVWNPLPREVADWWRRRAATSLRLVDGRWQAVGAGENEVSIAFAMPSRDRASSPG